MKLKFVLVPLVVLGFVVGSYADCSKDEIMKLLDKGYSKSEVDGVCGKSDSKKESKWISPTQKVCKANGGEMDGSTCKANWSNAKDICRASGGRLSSLSELKKVVVDCGGILNSENKNYKDSSYQSCYQNKGFSNSYPYWSSTSNTKTNIFVWFVHFNFGGTGTQITSNNFYVQCVK